MCHFQLFLMFSLYLIQFLCKKIKTLVTWCTQPGHDSEKVISKLNFMCRHWVLKYEVWKNVCPVPSTLTSKYKCSPFSAVDIFFKVSCIIVVHPNPLTFAEKIVSKLYIFAEIYLLKYGVKKCPPPSDPMSRLKTWIF